MPLVTLSLLLPSLDSMSDMHACSCVLDMQLQSDLSRADNLKDICSIPAACGARQPKACHVLLLLWAGGVDGTD